jgi:hypothetical protein
VGVISTACTGISHSSLKKAFFFTDVLEGLIYSALIISRSDATYAF